MIKLMFALYSKNVLTHHVTLSSEWSVNHFAVKLRFLGAKYALYAVNIFSWQTYLALVSARINLQSSLWSTSLMNGDGRHNDENEHEQLRTLYRRMADEYNKVKI